MNIKTGNLRHLFICGHPKSGTSLLRNLMDSHPELIVYPEETRYFRRFAGSAKERNIDENIKFVEENILNIFEWDTNDPPDHQKGFEDRDYSSISYKDVKNEFRKYLSFVENIELQEFLTGAFIAYATETGQLGDQKKWLVEKTPYNEFFLKEIYELWPDAKSVYIVRDPRDNYASYVKKHKDWTVKLFCENWNRSISEYLVNLNQLGKQKTLLIKYEDLINSFEETINRVLGFLDIDFDESLHTPSRAGDLWRGNSMFEQDFDAVSNKPIGRYRSELDEEETALIEILCKRYMRLLGYEIEGNWKLKVIIKGAYYKIYHKLFRIKQKMTFQKKRTNGKSY